jgi:hypothetical protein
VTVAQSAGAPEEPARNLAGRRDSARRLVFLVVAVVELAVAVAAVWTAFWCWPRGVATITTVIDANLSLVSTRYYGNWMALAIVAGTVAALCLIAAGRHLLRAVLTRRTPA